MERLIPSELLRQHLIDPEICIRCNTCEATCPARAISHDDRNYVVDAQLCNGCLACISPCPTGAIDNWRNVARERAYSVAEQLGWEALPRADAPAEAGEEPEAEAESSGLISIRAGAPQPDRPRATPAPWSAEQPCTNLYTPREPVLARVRLNVNCTEPGFASETHHIVLDFGGTHFPVLEGQSIGVLPPGVDVRGHAHRMRLYSVASARDGEGSVRSHVALTVKRVTEDGAGRPLRGVASNYLCDLRQGEAVQVVGPFGDSFLMPNHERANLLMICTGTGSAPMRAMTERRRKLRRRGHAAQGKLLLFFGARSQQELPYHGPLQSLPSDLIDIRLAFSRAPGAPRRYVQDLMRERADELGALLADPETYIYVCGITQMEQGVLAALEGAAERAGLSWPELSERLRREGRLHLETY
jgi:benzoyl-CoA 2,3-epoxidase subunit A